MKKISALLICLLMIVTCGLAGCASFSINKVKYYNEVLAMVDETKITRFDLLTAYNSYGNSYYVQQMGQSESQALNSTLDLLIDRELMYQYALENDAKFKPTSYQVNKAVEEMFESLDGQMNKYVEKAKKILNIESEDVKEDKEEAKSYKLKDYNYSPRAAVKSKEVDGSTEYYIEYIVEDEEQNYEKLIDVQYLTNFSSFEAINEIKNKYFEHFLRDLQDEGKTNAQAIYEISRNMFVKDLINYEFYLRDSNGKKFDKATENLLTRYFERTFKSQIQSQYLENIRIDYLKNEELSIELLIQEYAYASKLSYDKYNTNHSGYQSAMKDIGTKGDTILYHPETDAQFGYFIHTLISFDSIKDNLKLLEEEKDKDEYDAEYKSLIANLEVTARDYDAIEETYTDGENKAAVSDILFEYNNIKNLSTYSERLSAFIQFMFKYSTDTATLSAGMPYVVGTNGYSAMVEEFNNEAIKLMEGNPGDMSNAKLSDLDSLCITEYGIHLLLYIGDVNSFDIPYSNRENVYIQSDDIDGNEMFNLYTKTINPLTKKTYFDMMFDLVYPAESANVYTSNNGYADFEKEIRNKTENNHPVTKFVTKINSTKTSLK